MGGAAPGADGGLFLTATTSPSAPRGNSLFVRYDARGCVAERLRLRSVSAGPPLLRGRHVALAGATYEDGLALVRIRR